MTKQELRKALERATGSPFIKASQFAQFIGDKNVTRVKRKYLKDIPAIDGRLYLIDEVADYLKGRIQL